VRSRFPIVEIGIVVVAAALIYILERPQYEANREDERRSDAVYNLYAYKAAIEKYTAYNKGVYPDSPDSVEPYLEGGRVEDRTPGLYPSNPYTGGILSSKDIWWGKYETIGASRDDSPKGPNGFQTGSPGSISVSWFVPPGESLATEYGVITFGTDGTPVFVKDPSGAKRIIVVHN
jgi:hypothetical protein